MLKRLAALAAVAGTVVLTVAIGGASSSSGAADKKVEHFDHVFVIMMENTGFESLLGNPNAPWINQAVQTYGVAGNYYGVTHPSQPNYVAATAGTTTGVPTDDDVTVNLPNIVDQLEAKHKTWKAYMQAYSLCATPLDHACGNQLYERKHNPFISFTDVQSNPSRVANIVDLTQLDADLASKDGKAVPDYAWISPDQCNDMHGRGGGGAGDPCDYSNVPLLVKAGDDFLATWVGKIMASKAWKGNSVIFVAWDESDYTNSPTDFGFGDTRGCCTADPGGGHVLTLVITRHQKEPVASFQPYNHYSMLRTIQDSWKLGCLGATCNTVAVRPILDLTKS